jgi:NAD(P)-dependent dehydrogenase (short-subunit alcohol dehydrogenase family)
MLVLEETNRTLARLSGRDLGMPYPGLKPWAILLDHFMVKNPRSPIDHQLLITDYFHPSPLISLTNQEPPLTTMDKRFTNKVALITGGTSGIGRATAIAFAKQGADVVIAGRREAEGAESLTLVQKAGGQGLFVRVDVNDESEIEAMVAKTLERFGRLDFAFNNAGVGGLGRATMTATADIYDQIMNINVRGVFFSMKHQIPAILQSGGGAIVNNASVLALRPSANSPIYSASKAAVVGLTKSAALEFAPKGLRINAICPAIIETDMTEQIRGDEPTRAYLLSLHPVGRFGQSEEVAASVLYLCSPEASFITGVALPLDGGFAA